MKPIINQMIHVLFSLPAFSALICLAMYLCSDKGISSRKDRQICISLTGYFLSVFFNWMSILFVMSFPQSEIWFFPLRYMFLLLPQVFFYRFIYSITRLPGDTPFPMWHYALPVLFGVIALARFSLTPGWVPEQAPALSWPDNKPAFNVFIFSPYKMRVLYDIIYIALSLVRIRRYRKEIENYASQLQQSYMGWLNLIIPLAVVLIIGPAMAAFITDHALLATQWLFIPVALLMAQHILIVYNVLIRNFIILKDSPEDVLAVADLTADEDKTFKTLNKKEFERVLAEKRPFTDKNLKITELANLLHTNRTYLSGFINTVYEMNFSMFINERRLAYLNELKSNPAMQDKTNLELIYMAGFGSYQSYVRAKEREKERTLLKV